LKSRNSPCDLIGTHILKICAAIVDRNYNQAPFVRGLETILLVNPITQREPEASTHPLVSFPDPNNPSADRFQYPSADRFQYTGSDPLWGVWVWEWDYTPVGFLRAKLVKSKRLVRGLLTFMKDRHV